MQSEKVNYLAKFEPLMSLFMMSHSSCLEQNKRTTGTSKTHTHHYVNKVRQAPNHVHMQCKLYDKHYMMLDASSTFNSL
jgi:hypothetical protein